MSLIFWFLLGLAENLRFFDVLVFLFDFKILWYILWLILGCDWVVVYFVVNIILPSYILKSISTFSILWNVIIFRLFIQYFLLQRLPTASRLFNSKRWVISIIFLFYLILLLKPILRVLYYSITASSRHIIHMIFISSFKTYRDCIRHILLLNTLNLIVIDFLYLFWRLSLVHEFLGGVFLIVRLQAVVLVRARGVVEIVHITLTSFRFALFLILEIILIIFIFFVLAEVILCQVSNFLVIHRIFVNFLKNFLFSRQRWRILHFFRNLLFSFNFDLFCILILVVLS